MFSLECEANAAKCSNTLQYIYVKGVGPFNYTLNSLFVQRKKTREKKTLFKKYWPWKHRLWCTLLFNAHAVSGYWELFVMLNSRLSSVNEKTLVHTGRELWVLVVSKFPNERPLMLPAVKYVGNMHGNEAVSREIILHFANFLLESYGKIPAVTRLLDTTQIHLMPSMNPDGFEAAREGECTGVLGRYVINVKIWFVFFYVPRFTP